MIDRDETKRCNLADVGLYLLSLKFKVIDNRPIIKRKRLIVGPCQYGALSFVAVSQKKREESSGCGKLFGASIAVEGIVRLHRPAVSWLAWSGIEMLGDFW